MKSYESENISTLVNSIENNKDKSFIHRYRYRRGDFFRFSKAGFVLLLIVLSFITFSSIENKRERVNTNIITAVELDFIANNPRYIISYKDNKPYLYDLENKSYQRPLTTVHLYQVDYEHAGTLVYNAYETTLKFFGGIHNTLRKTKLLINKGIDVQNDFLERQIKLPFSLNIFR